MKNTPEINHLKKVIFSEPTEKSNRPKLLEYINLCVDDAKELSAEQLTGAKGRGVAMEITGAIGFQGAKGVSGEDWVTESDEPVLYQILNLAGRLEVDADNTTMWQEMFKLVAKLK